MSRRSTIARKLILATGLTMGALLIAASGGVAMQAGGSYGVAVTLLAAGGVFTLVVLIALAMTAKAVVKKPLGGLSRSVEALSAGRYDQAVHGTDSDDEIGAVARALDGFRHGLADGERQKAEREAQWAAAEAEHRRQAGEAAALANAQARAADAVGEGLERLAQGDLIWRMREDAFQGDDVQTPRDFNAAVEDLQATLAGVLNAARNIRGGCVEMGDAAEDLAQRTERQASGLAQTAAALDQITATVKRSAEGAERARQVTITAKAAAERSGTVVTEAVEAMGGIEKSSQSITQIIAQRK